MQQRHQFQIMWQSTNSTYRLVNTYHRQGTILGKEQDTALHSRKDVKYTKKKLDTFAKVKETPQKHIYENIQQIDLKFCKVNPQIKHTESMYLFIHQNITNWYFYTMRFTSNSRLSSQSFGFIYYINPKERAARKNYISR